MQLMYWAILPKYHLLILKLTTIISQATILVNWVLNAVMRSSYVVKRVFRSCSVMLMGASKAATRMALSTVDLFLEKI